MTDLARLGIVITSEQAELAEDRLDGMAKAADRAEHATDDLATAARRAGGATATMNTGLRAQQAVLATTRGSLGLTATEGLNLSRQFTDIGVTAAMGMNPLMIAIQQGPQIMDTFQMAATRTGTSIKAVMRGVGAAIWTAMAPLLPFIAAVGAAAAVIGGTLALSTRALNKDFGDLTKGMKLTEDQLENVKNRGVTMGDVVGGTLNYLRDIIWDRIGPAVTAIGEWFSNAMDVATRALITAVRAITGGFIGSFRAIRAIWGQLPAVMSDLAVSAVNATIRAVETMINSSVRGINLVIGAAKQLATINPAFAAAGSMSFMTPVDLAEMANSNAGAARAAGRTVGIEMAAGAAEGAALVDRQLAALGASIRGSAESRIRKEAGDGDAERAGGGSAVRQAREVAEIMDRVENVNLKPLTAFVEMVNPLRTIADEMRLIHGLAQETATGLASAFGESGRALGDLLTAMSGYQSRMAEINLAENEYRLSAAQADRERAMAQVQNYGDMLGAAKGFFKEGSDGYKVLQAAEQAYRVFQFAMSVQTMVQRALETTATVAGAGVETAAVVGAETVKTGATAAGTAIRLPLKLAEGAASMFAALGPFGFPLVAAMLAVMATLGFAGGGGGRGGGSRGTYNPAPINSRDESIATARSQASATQGAAANGAQRVDVRVTADDRRFNAYVDQRAQPYANAVGSAAVQTSRAAVPADRSRSEAFKMGGRGR